ncbi:MAG: insulinase family protein [Lachnospiraceae bacterium]|nr:insulinase family protein [Lachnospiraceae bacterium]
MRDIVRQTKLSNDLTVYLRKTNLKPGLVYLILSVKVGSFDDGAQKGIAHLLEHCNMGFEKYRKPTPILHYRARAYTDYYSTNYIFTVQKAEFDMVFSLLQELLLGKFLKPVEFSEIKQDVLVEYQRKQEDVDYQSMVRFFSGTAYAIKLPVGEPEIVRSLSFWEVETFFFQQYIPERMAVMAVGDLPEGVEEKIRKLNFLDMGERKTHPNRITDCSTYMELLEKRGGSGDEFFSGNMRIIHCFYLLPQWETKQKEKFLKQNFLYDFCSDVIAKALDGKEKYSLDKKSCQRSFFAPARELMFFSVTGMGNLLGGGCRNIRELRREILSIVLGWLDKNFENIREEYRAAFRQPQNYISVKLMFQQCVDHYIYKRPFADYGYENRLLFGALDGIEKYTVAGLLERILEDCAIVGEE